MIRETSMMSYNNLPQMGEDQLKVFTTLKKLKSATDSELAFNLGFSDPNKVRPRRKELFDQGLVIEDCRRICSITKRTVISWKLISEGAKIISPESISLSLTELNNLFSKLKKANSFQLDRIINEIDQIKQGV